MGVDDGVPGGSSSESGAPLLARLSEADVEDGQAHCPPGLTVHQYLRQLRALKGACPPGMTLLDFERSQRELLGRGAGVLMKLAIWSARQGDSALREESTTQDDASTRSGFQPDGPGRGSGKRCVGNGVGNRGQVCVTVEDPGENLGGTVLNSLGSEAQSVEGFPTLRSATIAQGYAKLKLDLLADLPKLPLSTSNNMQQLVALIEGVKDSVSAMRIIVGDDHPTRWTRGWEKTLQKHSRCAVWPGAPEAASIVARIGDAIAHVTRLQAEGTSGPDALAFLVRVLSRELSRFGVCHAYHCGG